MHAREYLFGHQGYIDVNTKLEIWGPMKVNFCTGIYKNSTKLYAWIYLNWCWYADIQQSIIEIDFAIHYEVG